MAELDCMSVLLQRIGKYCKKILHQYSWQPERPHSPLNLLSLLNPLAEEIMVIV